MAMAALTRKVRPVNGHPGRNLLPTPVMDSHASSIEGWYFRKFLAGDLGGEIFSILNDAKSKKLELNAALYELGDEPLEDALIALKTKLKLVLANGSDKSGDGNAEARQHLNANG